MQDILTIAREFWKSQEFWSVFAFISRAIIESITTLQSSSIIIRQASTCWPSFNFSATHGKMKSNHPMSVCTHWITLMDILPTSMWLVTSSLAKREADNYSLTPSQKDLSKAAAVSLTLICRPLNKDSSSAMAVRTDSLSANSMYAKLKPNHTHTLNQYPWQEDAV